jgi:predicted 3-demethylubiquinone-9 3-methyltransferase (glyoxalase superfamily)
MQKITPFLWFDSNAEDAARFYTSIFKDSKITAITRYGQAAAAASGRPQGSVMTVAFQLEGQEFTALNGGPISPRSPGISFVVNCRTQEEVDYYWEKLSAGGDEKAQQCGWLQDKFGVSWQVVPSVLPEMLTDSDQRKSDRMMAALVQMKKLDIETLQRAFNGQG